MGEGGRFAHALATPRFSMAGILCPAIPDWKKKLISMELAPQSVVSCSFQWRKTHPGDLVRVL